VLAEGEGHLAGEVLDGADLFEGLTEALGDEPFEGLALDGDEVGDGEDLGDLAEGESWRGRGTRVAQQASLPFRGKQV